MKAGGRYFSIMALCSYGLKCGISEQKIRRDAYAFLDHLESLTEDEGQPFQPGRCKRRSPGIERGQKKAVNDSKPGMDRGQHKGYDTSK